MSDFSISQERQISAPIAVVRENLNDLRKWENWSPWQLLDPQMTQTYTGAESGVGAKMHWEGNKEAGSGAMEVITDEPTLVEIDINFFKPYKAQNRSHFYLTPISETETHVKWEMTGAQNLFMKIIFRLFNMEKRIQQDFQNGLNRLAATTSSTGNS